MEMCLQEPENSYSAYKQWHLNMVWESEYLNSSPSYDMLYNSG